MSNELPPISGSGSEPSAPPPIRVEQVAYYNPSHYAYRPGSLTAIAVIGIILAGLGGLLSLASIASSAIQYSVPRMTTFSTTTTTSTVGGISTTTYSTNSSNNVTSPAGIAGRMKPENRDHAVKIFNSVLPLSPQHRTMLGQLFDAAGDDPFPFGESSFTDDRLRQAISGSGQVAGDQSKQYFLTANGRIEVSDSSAVFMPNNGQAVVVAPSTPSTAGLPRSVSTGAVSFSTSMPQISTSALTVMIISQIFSLLLCAFLLYASIRVLMEKPTSGVLMRRYAVLKFGAIVFNAIATWNFSTQLYSSMGPTPLPIPYLMLIAVAPSVIFGLIFPISVMIVFSTRSVKAYYQGLIHGVTTQR